MEFLSILADAGIQSVKLPPRSPNLNAYAERFVRTIKEGCLEQMIFFGEDSLRNTIREFVEHYHYERNHKASAIGSSFHPVRHRPGPEPYKRAGASVEC
jgi:putative transposase